MLWVLLFVIAASLAVRRARSRVRQEQVARDLRAAKISANVLSRDAPPGEPFVLFLTPFESRMQSLELFVLDAARQVGPVVSLGVKGVGAGRIDLYGITWREAVLRLMHHASAIVLVPFASSGVIWELTRAARDIALRSKLIVLFPDEKARLAGFRWRWFHQLGAEEQALDAFARADDPAVAREIWYSGARALKDLELAHVEPEQGCLVYLGGGAEEVLPVRRLPELLQRARSSAAKLRQYVRR